MTKKSESSGNDPQTPMEKFTDAARHIFNLPKSDVEKVRAKIPYRPKKRQKRT
jgi:hypothetical protein